MPLNYEVHAGVHDHTERKQTREKSEGHTLDKVDDTEDKI